MCRSRRTPRREGAGCEPEQPRNAERGAWQAHAGTRWPEAGGCAILAATEEAALYTYHQKRMIAGYVFISPWVIGFLVFVVGSLLASLFLSFTNWNALSRPQFIGFKNYAKLFFDDPLFWKSVKVTALYSLSIPLNLVFGLLIAVLLNQKIKGLGIFRTIYYLPSVIVGRGGVAAVGVDLQPALRHLQPVPERRCSGSRGRPGWRTRHG